MKIRRNDLKDMSASMAVQILAVASVVLLNSACNPVAFDKMKVTEPSLSAVTPDPDVPQDPDVPVDLGSLTKGACAADSSTRLLSCMNCPVPTAPVVSQFSRKGEALFEIMNRACEVRNGSDPQGYIPPTRAELLRRMNRLSPTLYPDSPMTAMQTQTIQRLMTEAAAVRDMFGGIFYSGVTNPTIAFETYFGIETIEARYTFCYASPANGTSEGTSSTFNRFNSSALHSKQWIDCQYGHDPFNCQEGPAYVAGNTYRTQLRNGMNESINNPYVAPPPVAAGTCEWEKYVGPFDAIASGALRTWLAAGFTVAGENETQCVRITEPSGGVLDELLTPRRRISMAAYRCQ